MEKNIPLILAKAMGILGVAIGSIAMLTCMALSQDPIASPSKEVDSIDTIHKEFDQYIARRKNLFDERDRIQRTIQETEQEFQKLANVSLKKQMEFLAFQWEQAALQQSAREQLSTEGRRAIAPRQVRLPTESTRLAQNASLASRDQLIAGIDLAQLDAASRVMVQRRLTAFQDGEKWQLAMIKWTNEGPTFYFRYWRFTDPCLIVSEEECVQYLRALQKHSVENLPAKLAAVLLEMRVGDRKSAMKSLEQVIEMKSVFQPIAIATRAIAYAMDDEVRKAKADMAAAMKLDVSNAYVRFLRGRCNAIQKDWSNAQQDFEVASKKSELTVDAHRNLVMIGLAKAESMPKLVSKVADSMTILQGFVDEQDWHFVYLKAWQGKFSTDKEKARDISRQAGEMAIGDKKEVCKALTESIADSKLNAWDYAFGK